MTRAKAATKAAVLGASPKEDRFSFKAMRMLKQHGFEPIPVHPAEHTVDGIVAKKSITDIEDEIDTLTMYVNAGISDKELDNILTLRPRRVIFNPGAENPTLAEQLRKAGIEVVENCTLVMLRTDLY